MNVYICLAVLCGVELAPVSRSDSVAGASQRPAASRQNFVEIIKKDLKRNNDDYKDLATHSKFLHTNKTLDVTIKKLPLEFNDKIINGKNNVKTFRRTKDRSDEYYELLNKETANNDKVKSSNATPQIFTNNTPRLRKLSPVFNFKPPVLSQSTTGEGDGVASLRRSPPGVAQNTQSKQRPSAASKLVNENKIHKFKQFVERNKKVFKEYISSKFNIPTPKAQLRQIPGNETEQNKLKQHEKEIKSKIWSEDDVGELRPATAAPAPAPAPALDMAPAKGGRIHKQRIKGRLCHRHVLLPEGPKYDSAGRWYRPPRRLRPAGPPRRPGPPRPPGPPRVPLLLPRCCNCCKKSVLGCE